ncbi:MAG: GDSL-type esterase/lipase family protein [Rhodospirillaceae bacterium]|nr:GDSL-type esterase/lipase family protein [Rhodospirillaceae bacterium]
MRICFFGESYVNGVGDPAYQGWAGRLCAKARARGADLTAYNCGIRGATSKLIARTWRQEADTRLAGIDKTAVVFSFGTNDCWIENGTAQAGEAEHMANVRAILTDANARWPTLMIGPPGLPTYAENTMREADHRARCDTVASICREINVPYFDTLSIFPSFKAWPREASAYDGAHPGAGGYAEMAEALDEWPPWRALVNAPR